MSLDLFATIPTVNETRLSTLAPPHPFRGIVHLAPGRHGRRGEGSFDVGPYVALVKRLTGVDLLQGEAEGVTRVPKEERSATAAQRLRRVPHPKVAEVAAGLARAFEQNPQAPPPPDGTGTEPPAGAAHAQQAAASETVEGQGEAQPSAPEDGERALGTDEWRDLVRFFQVCARHRYGVSILME